MNAKKSLPILKQQDFHHRFETDLIAAKQIDTLQVNIGRQCNLACRHCHIESSPALDGPDQNMSGPTMDRVLQWIADWPQIRTIDITGGSPEMNPNFRRLVRHCHKLGRHVMDRYNPTIFNYADRRQGRDYRWIPKFLADNEVEVIASMPCYLEENVDLQRGGGAYEASIDGLRCLNDVGYGRDPKLRLHLVYNPNGPHLPPSQAALAGDYHRELKQRFGLVFNDLWAITNMPIKRWRHELERQNRLVDYMQLLIDSYNPDTIEGLMCRHQIHIDHRGKLYDCDFNYALELPVILDAAYLWDVTPRQLGGRRIATDNHCYGCTAGSGSSCGGTLVD